MFQFHLLCNRGRLEVKAFKVSTHHRVKEYLFESNYLKEKLDFRF